MRRWNGLWKSAEDATDEDAIVTWLRKAMRPGRKVVCICTGALVAGRAGLLDGHTCTTHYLVEF